MEENPTTEEWEYIEALGKQVSGEGLPDKLSLLRQKLSQKAKQEHCDRWAYRRCESYSTVLRGFLCTPAKQLRIYVYLPVISLVKVSKAISDQPSIYHFNPRFHHSGSQNKDNNKQV